MARMSNILLVASFPESILSFRGSLIAAMQEQGMRVSVAAPGLPVGNAIRTRLEALGVSVHDVRLQRAGVNPIRDFLLMWQLFVLMRKAKTDMVLSYTVKPVIYGSIAAWLARVPHRYALVTGLGFAFTGERHGLVPILVKNLYRFALGKVDKVFFQNPDDERLLTDVGVLSDRSATVVVNGSGVNLYHYSFAPTQVGKPEFLMICRLLGDKGVREYAQAAKKLNAQHPDAEFKLVGWIDENPDSISQCELDSWVKHGDIEFLGRLDDVRPAISDCTVYVLPSYREGTPRTVLEAMAMGRPIITTDAPGCRETVIDGENGFLVPVKSVDALVEAMRKFIDDPELAVRMGKRSRETAEEKYDVHKVNAVMLREMGIT